MASKPFDIVLQTIFHEYQNKNYKIKTSFVSRGLQALVTYKTGLNLIIILILMSAENCL